MRISVAIFASLSVAGLALTICSRAADFDTTANLTVGDRPLLRAGSVDESIYRATDGYYFRTADGGIACGFLDEPFGQPKRPVGCQGTTQPTPPAMQACWGIDPSAAALAVGENAGYLCVNRGYFVGTTSGADTDAPVLPVGSSLSVAGFTCLAQPVGVTCRNDATGHGFEITPENNRIF
ncbi:hypothetical protein ACIHDR_39725 [Nocardia sp. NPDC052278]|uniref:hypothetical protein n=1 Tax=unclassified Nocardia TaxID=2637762 RepID=UPI0036938637